GGLSVLLLGDAEAGNTVPASICQPMYDNGDVLLSNIFTMENWSADTTRSIFCAIPGDNVMTGNITWRFNISDECAEAEQIRCQGRTYAAPENGDPEGPEIIHSTGYASDANGDNQINLSGPAMAADYWFQGMCDLPPKSAECAFPSGSLRAIRVW